MPCRQETVFPLPSDSLVTCLIHRCNPTDLNMPNATAMRLTTHCELSSRFSCPSTVQLIFHQIAWPSIITFKGFVESNILSLIIKSRREATYDSPWQVIAYSMFILLCRQDDLSDLHPSKVDGVEHGRGSAHNLSEAKEKAAKHDLSARAHSCHDYSLLFSFVVLAANNFATFLYESLGLFFLMPGCNIHAIDTTFFLTSFTFLCLP